MQTVAIAGVGLIGGSFALALRQAGFKGRILGVSSPATIDSAKAGGVIDEGTDLESACAQADLLYLAQPILAILDVIPKIAPWIRPGMRVTDAGSTKAQIVELAGRLLPTGSFIGGHPMAGKEVRGVQAADANLFDGRPYILTPINPGDLETGPGRDFFEWLERIKAKPIVMDPNTHDSVVARTSHVPQLLSTALALSIDNIPEAGSVAGPGLLDMTRLAASPYEIWHDILVTNHTQVSAGLSEIIDNLLNLQKILNSDDLGAIFAQARVAALKLRENR